MAETNADRPGAAVGVVLAFIAGFVDTTGFIVLTGIFLAHVTGNFVLLGAAIATGSRDVWGHVAVLPHFVLGVAAAWAIGRISGANAPRVIAIAQAVLLAGAAVSGTLAQNIAASEQLLLMVAMALGVTAMGAQSVLARSLKLPMTHVMTGNVTQVTVDFLESRVGGTKARVGGNIALIGAFLGGALAAGVMTPYLGMPALGVPAVILIVLAIGPWLDGLGPRHAAGPA